MQPRQDLVKSQANLAKLNQLTAKYNQLYKTYLQQVQIESSKRDARKYPYNIKNPNEIKNTLTPNSPFPSNGNEQACFKSCVDTENCAYALYSNSGCGIDCNPNKCLLYGANAEGIVPVDEVPTNLPTCPVDAAGTDAWCKSFNHPATNSIIPVLVLRTAVSRGNDGKITGRTDWRSLAMQMPKPSANAADVPFSVDLTTNLQTWSPDSQFSDVNSAPDNEISFQFRFFAEYWLNAYNIMSGNTTVIAGQGPIGTFAFSKLTKVGTSDPNNADGSVSYVGTFDSQIMFWNSENPSTGGTAAGLKTAAALASTSEAAKFNYNYSAFENSTWKVKDNYNALSGQIPPQLAGMSIPSWQFLGLQDSADACQLAADNDPSHVYDLAVYHNASYTGNNVFIRACYGHVAGAPESTISSVNEDNIQTMTPPYGLTKPGGEKGIVILKKMYQLNQQITALVNEMKLSSAADTTKEAFTQQGDDDNIDNTLSDLTNKLQVDADKLNEEIQEQNKIEGDEQNAKRMLLYSRIKLGVAIALGLLLAYLAYRFLTADELPTTIENELMPASNGNTGYLDRSNDLE
jgi:hypothetical protein